MWNFLPKSSDTCEWLNYIFFWWFWTGIFVSFLNVFFKRNYLIHLNLLRHFQSVFSLFSGKVAQLVKCRRVICVFLLNLLMLSNFLKVIVISTSTISYHEALLSANIMSAHLTFLRTQSPEVKGMKEFWKQFRHEVCP